MPKLLCPCGYIHNLSAIPDDGYRVLTDWKMDDLMNEETEEKRDEIYSENVGLMYECPECGRIMWEKPNEDRFRIFKPEEFQKD